MLPRLLAAVPLILGIPAAALAAEQPASPPQQSVAANPENRADLDFAGGPLKAYIEAVARAFGSANAAIPPGAESIPLTPVRLTNATRKEAMFLIGALSAGRAHAYAPPNLDVYQVSLDVGHPQQRIELRVWPLAKTLARMKPDEALSAVQAALDMTGGKANVKFHSDTSLLIVRGTIEELDAVGQVVNRLESVAEWKEIQARAEPAGSDAAAKELADANRRLAELELENKGLRNTINLLELDVAALQKRLGQ